MALTIGSGPPKRSAAPRRPKPARRGNAPTNPPRVSTLRARGSTSSSGASSSGASSSGASPTRPTAQSRAFGRAAVSAGAAFTVHSLHARFDATEAQRERDAEQVGAARLDDAARVRDRADAALADVPSDIERLTFEVERENGGAEALREDWERSLRGSIGPGDPEAVERSLEENANQLDLLSTVTFGGARPNDAEHLLADAGAEHLYEPIIATLAQDNPNATFELVAADRRQRGVDHRNEAPLIAMTTTADDGTTSTQFLEVNHDSVLDATGADRFEEAVFAAGRTEEVYAALQQHPEYAALDEGDADSTLFRLQHDSSGAAFDVLGDLPPEAQAEILHEYAALNGDATLGGLIREVMPPAGILVAVDANHLATGGRPPDVLRSTTDIGGVVDNGKDLAILDEHRDALYAPVFSQYLLRGERPPLDDVGLVNEIGTAIGFAPNRFPETEEELAAFESGAFAIYGDEARDFIDPIAEQIDAIGGSPANVQTIPLLVESDPTGRPPSRPIPLFRVEDRNGDARFVDDTGRAYDSVEDWRANNRLPPGRVTYPADLSLTASDSDRPAEVDTVSEATHAVRDTPGEYALAVLDGAALVGGVALGAVAIAGTGGAASPAVAAAITYGGAAVAGYSAVRAGIGLYDRASHGESIDPLQDGAARSLWLDGISGAIGFSAFGGAAAARNIARAGNAGLASTALRSATVLNAVGQTADLATIGNLAHTLARDFDDLSVADRVNLVAQIGFWGGVSRAGSASTSYAASDVRASIQNTADTLYVSPGADPSGPSFVDGLDFSSYTATPGDGSGTLGVPGAIQVEARAEELALRPELAHLSPTEIEAILLYTGAPGVVGGQFRLVNQALRSGDPVQLAQHEGFIRSTTSALNQLPSFDGTVYRHTSLPPEVAANLVEGATYSDPGFLSTTTSDFVDAPPTAASEYIFAIETSPDSNGHDISDISNFAGEHEVLFTPHTQFTVTDRAVDPASGRTIIYLREQ